MIIYQHEVTDIVICAFRMIQLLRDYITSRSKEIESNAFSGDSNLGGGLTTLSTVTSIETALFWELLLRV